MTSGDSRDHNGLTLNPMPWQCMGWLAAVATCMEPAERSTGCSIGCFGPALEVSLYAHS